MLAGLLVVFGAGACSPRFPLRITEVSISPPPAVGEIAVLRIEVMSSEDEPDALIRVLLPVGIRLVKGQTTWNGSLEADTPKVHELAICVLYEGEWKIDIDTRAYQSEDSSYGDEEILHIRNAGDTVDVISSSRYRYTQPPGGIVNATPTPLPPLTIPVCP
jgi:hypothetical protein